MGGERVEHLPEELERWVGSKASESDIERAAVVERALTAYRLVDDEEFEGRVDELDGRVSDLEADLDEKVTDLRERVIQVKRESDAKASAEHDHPELAAEADRALAAVEEVRDAVSTLERRMEGGFENYEDVLEYLTDAAEETETKLDAVAGAIVDLRERTAEAERVAAERTAGTELKREANRKGVSSATCEACEESVDVSLLDVPYCPHCGETFDGVREKRRFFGSSTLTTGRRPALEDPSDASASEPVFDGDDSAVRDDSDDAAATGEDDGPAEDSTEDAATAGQAATETESEDRTETERTEENAVEDEVNA